MRTFKTESKKLLDLMINSIYTNREIFLRELVSNASDAIDKRYLKGLTDASYQVDRNELAISLNVDPEARTITVSDDGIGMNADELDRNLGTIAHSGSEEFRAENAQEQGNAVDIIGRFGVGFYSAFMVAREVEVITRALGNDTCYRWHSDGIEGYTIDEVSADDPAYRASCGTDVILHVREDATDEEGEEYSSFLTEWRIRELIRRYSNYVRYPVRMLVTKSRQKEAPASDDAEQAKDAQPEWEQYQELETLNSMTPIWRRRASEVSKEDYAEFYRSTFRDWVDPARTFSLHAEGTLEYDALLFIPGQAPFDLYSRDYEKGLQLYSANVLIMEKCAELLPDYYNFVRGVVDSPDVTLNISRETLQQTRQLQAMAKRIERKVTSELEAMRDTDREAYEKFFNDFGRGLKYGIYQSYGAKKDELSGLMLYWSVRHARMITLAEYAAEMSEDQTCIYYAAGDDRDRLAKMPVVRTVLDKGFDVLLCTQDVDEFCFQAMHDFEYTPVVEAKADADAEAESAETAAAEPRRIELKNVSSGDLGLATEEERVAAEEIAKANEALLTAMTEALGERVSRVAVSTRLAADGAPATVTSEGPLSLEMERVLAAGPEAMEAPRATRVLELNAEHPVFARLQEAQNEANAERVSLYADLLYNQALLVEGHMPEDPVAFAAKVCELM